MKIIRDEDCLGLAMIPLFCDWHIKRCNWEGCICRPSTIVITEYEGEPLRFGLCESHYLTCALPGETTIPLIFDDFNAFEQKGEDNHDNESRVDQSAGESRADSP